MRNIIFVLWIFLLSCTEEKLTVRDYPRVRTLTVELKGEDVVFHAEVLSQGTSATTDHGFTWSTSYPNIKDSPKISLGAATGATRYTASAKKSQFVINKTYVVRAYAVSEGYEVYGTDQSFIIK